MLELLQVPEVDCSVEGRGRQEELVRVEFDIRHWPPVASELRQQLSSAQVPQLIKKTDDINASNTRGNRTADAALGGSDTTTDSN